MKSRRTIVSISALLAILVATVPASASANSLLSGYGGPGAGDQAILGSTLLNGPRGGNGASGAGSPGGSLGSISSSSTGAVSAGGGGGQGSAKGSSSTTARSGKRVRGNRAGRNSQTSGGSGDASSGAAYADGALSRSGVSSPAAGGSETLGLSGEELIYIFLVFGALAFTGVLTRRLIRTTRPEGTS